MIIVLVGIFVISSFNEFSEESREYYQKQSQINSDVQRCNELRGSGFFSSVGQPVGSTTPNPNPDEGYRSCIARAQNP